MTAMQNAKSALGTGLVTVEALLALFVGTVLALFTVGWLFREVQAFSAASRKMMSLMLSPGPRMALMRSTTAASTWMKPLAPIGLHRPPRWALGQRRGDGVIGPSSAAHSRDVRRDGIFGRSGHS